MQIIERLLSPTPKFWKKVIKVGLICGTLATAIAAAPDNILIPNWMDKGATYLATIGYLAAILAKLTTTDSELTRK